MFGQARNESGEILGKCEVQGVDVKSLESTQRKLEGSVVVTFESSLTWVTAICDTPEALKKAYSAIMGMYKQEKDMQIYARPAILEVVQHKLALHACSLRC